MSTEKQVGPPVTIDGWLIRVIDDEEFSHVLAKATNIENKSKEIIVTPYGVALRGFDDAPAKVLEAVLKVGGWKAVRPDRP